MAMFWDNPMFTSPTNTPTVLRYPGTDFGLLPPWAYNTPWSPATASTPSLPPTAAAPPPGPAAPPIPLPRPRPPLLLAPPIANPNAIPPAPPGAPQDPTNNNINPALANPLASHAATLMALGAGIAQGGIGRGLAMASAAADNERNRAAQQMSFLQTYKALTEGGVPQEEALAAVLNPSLMRSLAAKYLGPRSRADVVEKTPAAVRGSVPPVPPGVPTGSNYSPASWTAPDGTVFDELGRAQGQ